MFHNKYAFSTVITNYNFSLFLEIKIIRFREQNGHIFTYIYKKVQWLTQKFLIKMLFE